MAGRGTATCVSLVKYQPNGMENIVRQGGVFAKREELDGAEPIIWKLTY